MASPRVTLRQGTFIGTSLHSPRSSSPAPHILDVFLGIPFALAPSGERRFRPPVAVSASTSTFDATRWGQRPPSSTMVGDEVPQGEDCLNANIFRPRARDGAKNEKLPVLVYFNGGAFNFGYAKSRLISSFVAWSEEPIIGVSFNYRVGALGFLPCKLMAKEGLLNLGLKDQSMLLEWVRENIGAFGGDPDNVTLMGTSAGAHSVSFSHLIDGDSPNAQFTVVQKSILPSSLLFTTFTHLKSDKVTDWSPPDEQYR
jgi:acetylcholinesterase